MLECWVVSCRSYLHTYCHNIKVRTVSAVKYIDYLLAASLIACRNQWWSWNHSWSTFQVLSIGLHPWSIHSVYQQVGKSTHSKKRWKNKFTTKSRGIQSTNLPTDSTTMWCNNLQLLTPNPTSFRHLKLNYNIWIKIQLVLQIG